MDTHVFQIRKHFPWVHTITRRMGQLMNLFGVTLRRLDSAACRHDLDIGLRPGDICYITGPSGAGKTVLMQEMYKRVDREQRIGLDEIPLQPNQSLIDSIDAPLFDAVLLLSKAGLSDALTMLQTPTRLSAGQQYRWRLAKALQSDKTVLFADEFMSSVDTQSAMIICRQLRRIATEAQKIFILAGVHDYFIPDLQPNVVVVKSFLGPAKIYWHDGRDKK